MRISRLVPFAAASALAASLAMAQTPAPPAPPPPVMPPSLPPTYTADLMTAQGTAALGAQWKTMDARIVEA